MTAALQTNRHVSRFDITCDMVAALRSGQPLDDTARETLLDFDGWGPVADLFGPTGHGTAAHMADLGRASARLSDLAGDAHKSAADSVDTSFYTPRPLVDAVWQAITAAGLAGGRVVDLGCGTGRFGVWAPAGWEYVGVEQDVITADAARALLPAATILTGDLADVKLPGTFDAAVGNVPFSASLIYADGRSDRLDTYFVSRAVSALRPGGVAVLITPTGWLDHCQEAALDAALVTAVRLPAGTFPGTQVVADIVVLRRGTDGATNHHRVALPAHSHTGFTATVSTWWRDNPHLVAGVMRSGSHSRRPIDVVTADSGADTARVLSELQGAVSGCAGVHVGAAAADAEPDALGIPAGTFLRDPDGAVRQVDAAGCTAPVKAGKELVALLDLRDAVKTLLAAEADTDMADALIAPTRQHALALYTNYVARYGPLNRGTLHEGKRDADTGLPKLSWRRPRMGGFRADPDCPLVMAVERYDQHTGEAEPAPILTRRVNQPPEPITSCATPAEAVAVSCGEGRFDIARVQSLLGLGSEAATLDALGDLVFRNPSTGAVEPAGQYLSGNIREKLAAAEAAKTAMPGARWGRNVTALRAAMPPQVVPGGFTCQLGSPLLAEADIVEFVTEALGAKSCTVNRAVGVGSWEVEAHGCDSTFTVSHRDAGWMVQQALNRRPPTITVYDPDKNRDVPDSQLTSAAQQQTARIAELFAEWVWTDGDRADRITADYNRLFRSHRGRTFDGAHLTFPGMDAQVRDRLWTWQRSMVDRMVSTPAVVCGHAPGGGKTLTMVAGAVTLRQFGLANKPMIVVPNHLLDQIAREAQQAYPLGRFLVASTEDLCGDGRASFLARCATGVWDAVIITHGAFTSIPVPADVEQTWLTQQIDFLRDSLRGNGTRYGFAAKEIARRVRSLEGKLDKLRDTETTRGAVTFDQLGVDYLAVDEAHLMKGLPITTRTTGLSNPASKRAVDLLLKATLLRWQRPGQPALGLFTGTPWLNSLSETYVWQKFCQPGRLAESGIDQFDVWAGMFVQQESRVEMRPDGGGMRIKTRPTKLLNVPELRAMLAEFADILPEGDMGAKRPATVQHIHTVAMNAVQRQKVASLVDRADHLSSSDKGADNMLVICGEGRRVALDPALVGLPGRAPKVDEAAHTIARIWADTKDDIYPGSDTPGSLQIVFCDQGTPQPGDSQTYGRLRSALIDAGVPSDRIRWVHEATDDRSRAALFAACRAGLVSVLIGSTGKLGLGTNVQTRAVAVHHLDAPWRPADVTQRDCRAVRPGNLNETVHLHRYVTERSFDALMWGTLERKAGFVAAFFRANTDTRTVDDISAIALSFGEIKAAAAGNPAVFELFEAQQKVAALRTMRAVESRSVTAARKAAKAALRSADRLDERADVLLHMADGWQWQPWQPNVRKAAADLRASRNSWRAPRATLVTHGAVVLTLQPTLDRHFTVEARCSYRQLETISRRTLTAAVEAAAEWWATVAVDPAAEAGRRAAAATGFRAEAERHIRAADTWQFSRAADLTAAETHLAALELSIADTATKAA